MELDGNLVLEKYKTMCADLRHENILLNLQLQMLFKRIAELEAPKIQLPIEEGSEIK